MYIYVYMYIYIYVYIHIYIYIYIYIYSNHSADIASRQTTIINTTIIKYSLAVSGADLPRATEAGPLGLPHLGRGL